MAWYLIKHNNNNNNIINNNNNNNTFNYKRAVAIIFIVPLRLLPSCPTETTGCEGQPRLLDFIMSSDEYT